VVLDRNSRGLQQAYQATLLTFTISTDIAHKLRISQGFALAITRELFGLFAILAEPFL